MLTREEIETIYQTKRGIIISPGKFEGEPLWCPYFYIAGTEGFAHDTYDGTDGCTEPVGATWVFVVTDDDRREFPELRGIHTVEIHEDSQGFVWSAAHPFTEERH